MEITIKINNKRELNRIREVLRGEKILVLDSSKRKINSKRSFKKPNKETLEVFEKTDKGIGLIRCKSVDDFFKKLGI
jgi:hypothetical protein